MSISTTIAGPFAGRLALALLLLGPAACDHDTAQPAGGAAATLADRGQPGPGNPVLHWSTIAGELMAEVGPVVDSRAFAILHAAIHDAVNGIERRYQPYTADLASPGASLDAAVATAARDVMVALSPTPRDTIDVRYWRAMAEIPDGVMKDSGVALGRKAAEANLARRSGDGVPVGPWPPQTGPITQPVYVPTGEPGDYAFTPPFDQPPMGPIALFPGWGRLRPFAVDIAKHRPPGPFALTSAEYAADLDSIKSMGSLHSETRTADQGQTAFFWFEGFITWHQIAIQTLRETSADPWDAARTLALMHFAITDAGIACFAAKYHFRFWRPYTAIRRAAEDGNAATVPDTAWLPLLWTEPGVTPQVFLIPPIPDYPSAAATIAGAAAEVLIGALGDQQGFEATSPFLPGVTRQYRSFTQAATENAMSRFYGGIHFLRAVRDGYRLGKGVGADVHQLLGPVRR